MVNLTKKRKKELWVAGQNNTYIEDILLQEASDFIKNVLKVEFSEEKHTEAIDIYRNGFLGKKEIK